MAVKCLHTLAQWCPSFWGCGLDEWCRASPWDQIACTSIRPRATSLCPRSPDWGPALLDWVPHCWIGAQIHLPQLGVPIASLRSAPPPLALCCLSRSLCYWLGPCTASNQPLCIWIRPPVNSVHQPSMQSSLQYHVIWPVRLPMGPDIWWLPNFQCPREPWVLCAGLAALSQHAGSGKGGAGIGQHHPSPIPLWWGGGGQEGVVPGPWGPIQACGGGRQQSQPPGPSPSAWARRGQCWAHALVLHYSCGP